MSKKPMDLAVLDEQGVFELPERQLMLVTVVIANVLNNLSVTVDVRNVNVAVQVCAAVDLLNTILVDDRLTCTIQQ